MATPLYRIYMCGHIHLFGGPHSPSNEIFSVLRKEKKRKKLLRTKSLGAGLATRHHNGPDFSAKVITWCDHPGDRGHGRDRGRGRRRGRDGLTRMQGKVDTGLATG